MAFDGKSSGNSSSTSTSIGTLEMMYLQQGTTLKTAFNEELTKLVNLLFLDEERNKHRPLDEQIERLIVALKMIRSPEYQAELEDMVHARPLSEEDFFRRISEKGIFNIFLKGVEGMIEARLHHLIMVMAEFS